MAFFYPTNQDSLLMDESLEDRYGSVVSFRPGMVAYACNSSTLEAKAGESLERQGLAMSVRLKYGSLQPSLLRSSNLSFSNSWGHRPSSAKWKIAAMSSAEAAYPALAV
ncbi:hypothetical protein AAY473_006642 [Plecturocebus cupreus]